MSTCYRCNQQITWSPIKNPKGSVHWKPVDPSTLKDHRDTCPERAAEKAAKARAECIKSNERRFGKPSPGTATKQAATRGRKKAAIEAFVRDSRASNN